MTHEKIRKFISEVEDFTWAQEKVLQEANEEIYKLTAQLEIARKALANKDQQIANLMLVAERIQQDKLKLSPLTTEEITQVVIRTKTAEPGNHGYILPLAFARAIEQAHGIGDDS